MLNSSIIQFLIYLKVTLVTFTTYIYTGDDHYLTPEKAFVSLALFDIMKYPLAVLPLLIVYIVEVKDKIPNSFIRLW